MATVGSVYPSTSSNGVTGTNSSSTGSNSQNSATANDPLANESTFLQLLVAQLQNQDPTQPVDGTTFVTQLAEFSDVEQNLGTRQDLDAVSEKYLGTTTPPSATSSLTSGGASTNPGTSSTETPAATNVNASTASQQLN